MSAQTLLGIRHDERQFINRQIEAWSPDHEADMRVRDLEDLIQACLSDRDKDNRFIRHILKQSCLLPREGGLDVVNDLLQKCCDDALATLNKLQERIRSVEDRGIPVEDASSIATAIDDYRRWQEDIPELLMMNHGPVKAQLRERIMAAVDSPASQSDWRELFDE